MRSIGMFFLVAICLLAEPALAGTERYVVGALGDSITTAFDSQGIGDNKDYSWSTGLDSRRRVNSHARQMKALNPGTEFVIRNEAVTGAHIRDLAKQTQKLLPHKPDYVTILLGANDLCSTNYSEPWPVDSRVQEVRNSIESLKNANPNVKIVVASIPDMLRLRSLGRAKGCQSKWDFLGICKSLLAGNHSDDELALFKERYDTLNNGIADLVSAYPQNARFEWALSQYEFPWEAVSSIDCFHPSTVGQNEIAELTFDPSWQ